MFRTIVKCIRWNDIADQFPRKKEDRAVFVVDERSTINLSTRRPYRVVCNLARQSFVSAPNVREKSRERIVDSFHEEKRSVRRTVKEERNRTGAFLVGVSRAKSNAGWFARVALKRTLYLHEIPVTPLATMFLNPLLPVLIKKTTIRVFRACYSDGKVFRANEASRTERNMCFPDKKYQRSWNNIGGLG